MSQNKISLKKIIIIFLLLIFVPAAFIKDLRSYLLLPTTADGPKEKRIDKISFRADLLHAEIEELKDEVQKLKNEKLSLIQHYDREVNQKWNQMEEYLKHVVAQKKGKQYAEQYLSDLNAMEPLEYIPMPATVIGEHLGQWDRELELNRGDKHGVKKGSPVVSGKVIVGVITNVTPWTSTMSHITNEGIKIPCRIGNDQNLRGLMVGEGHKVQGEYARIKYLDRRGDFSVGHKVFSGSVTNDYPSGFLLGMIKKKSKRDSDMYYQVLMEPAIPFYEISNVVILLPVESEEK